jgi:hypothetical protein
MNQFLAGLTLVALAAAKRKRFRFDREVETETTTQRGARKRPAPKAKGKPADPLSQRPLKKLAHKHTFVLGGVEINTKDTLRDPSNPDRHTHLLEPSIMVQGPRRGTKRRIRVKLATTFDPFGPSHTHKVTVRGKVHTSGGPFR